MTSALEPVPEWAEDSVSQDFWNWWATYVTDPSNEQKWRITILWAYDGWVAGQKKLRGCKQKAKS